MQGALGTRQGRALYLLAWLLFGAALAWLLSAATGTGLAASLLFAVPLMLVYGVAAGFSAYYLCRAHPVGATSAWRMLAVFGFASLLTASLWTLAALAWHELWQQLAPDFPSIGWNRTLAATVFGLGAILYGLCVVADYLAIAFERTRELETRALQGELTARDAELRMLRTQVDPHFLFNSLNSISALTAINPAGARDMTVQLAEFFRSTLSFEANSRVTLDEELRLLHHFIAIEQVRFGQRLGFVAEVEEEAAGCLLPPLVLQPLVENAIKHGIGQLVDGGQVRISARRAGSLLSIAIENDIDDECVPKKGTGLGIANVRQRLAAAYGHEASVHCAREGQVYRAELVLPAHTKEN